MSLKRFAKQMERRHNDFQEVVAAGGVVKSSEWVTGTGKRTASRPLPWCGFRQYADLIRAFPDSYPDYVNAYLRANPRVRSVVYVRVPV